MSNEPTPMSPKNFLGKKKSAKDNLLGEPPFHDPFEGVKGQQDKDGCPIGENFVDRSALVGQIRNDSQLHKKIE